jgi:hypothetical protein
MSDVNYIVLNIDDGNGHQWIEILKTPHGLIGKTVCKQCGYFRRVNGEGIALNKQCKGPVRVELR